VNTTVEHSPTLATTHQGEPCIALDGDKLKPRTDQRKGGNGFGVNEDGAGYTLTAVDRHGVAYGTKAKRTWWNDLEVATTITTTGHNQLMPDKDRFDAVVECQDVQCYDMTHADDPGRKVADGVSPTLQSRMGTGGNQVPLAVSTNSNGEDVAPTVNANMSKLGGDNQTTFGGGVLHHTANRRMRKDKP
jgi:hypothetical protein